MKSPHYLTGVMQEPLLRKNVVDYIVTTTAKIGDAVRLV